MFGKQTCEWVATRTDLNMEEITRRYVLVAKGCHLPKLLEEFLKHLSR
jgi:hypothetical protein